MSDLKPIITEEEIESPLAYILRNSFEETLKKYSPPEVYEQMMEQMQEQAEKIVKLADPQPGDKWYSWTYFVHPLNAHGGLMLKRGDKVIYQQLSWIS